MTDPTRTHAPTDPSGSATRTANPHTVSHPQTDDALPASTADSTQNADGFAAPPGFVVEREIGVGGMGVVYLARQVGLNRPVALKLVKGGQAVDAKAVIRFLAEAEAVAAVRHPNVVEVYQYGEHAGRPYLALEYCPGGDLTRLVSPTRERGTNDFRHIAELMAQVADGVNAAHAQGIVHRDLKPHNVFLAADGTPKVADFGLAKRGLGSDLTRTNAVMGTPAYMAPEQASGGTKFVGPEADVWALGVMLYELASGSRPTDTSGPVLEALAKVAKADIPPLRTKCPAVPTDLALIAHKCLHADPRDRYPTAGALAADLRNWLDGKPISARPASTIEQAVKWAKRNKKLAGMGAAVVIAALVTITGLTVAFRREAWASAEAKNQKSQAEDQRGQAVSARDRAERTLSAVRLIEAARAMGTSPQRGRSTLDQIPNEHRNLAWHMLSRSADRYHQVTYCPHPLRDGRPLPFHRYWVSPSGSHVALGDDNEIWLCPLTSHARPAKLIDEKQFGEQVSAHVNWPLTPPRLRFTSPDSLVIQAGNHPALSYNLARQSWKVGSGNEASALTDYGTGGKQAAGPVADTLTVDGRKLQLVSRARLADGRRIELRAAELVDDRRIVLRAADRVGVRSQGLHVVCIRPAQETNPATRDPITTFPIPDVTRLDSHATLTPSRGGRLVILNDTTNAIVIDTSDGTTRSLAQGIAGSIWQIAVSGDGHQIAFVHHLPRGGDVRRVGVTITDPEGRVEIESSYESPAIQIDSKTDTGKGSTVEWSSFSIGPKVAHAKFSDDGSTFCFIENDDKNGRTAIHRVAVGGQGVGPTWKAHERRIAVAAVLPSGDLTTVDVAGIVRNWREDILQSQWTIPESGGAASVVVRDRSVLVLSWKADGKFALTRGDWASAAALFTGRVFDRRNGKELLTLPQTAVTDEKTRSPKKALQLGASENTRLPMLSPEGDSLAQLLEVGGRPRLRCVEVETGTVALDVPADDIVRIGFSGDGRELLALRKISPWRFTLVRFGSRDGNPQGEVNLDTPTRMVEEFDKLIPEDLRALNARMEKALADLKTSLVPDHERSTRLAEQFTTSDLVKIQQYKLLRERSLPDWPLAAFGAFTSHTDARKHNWNDFFNRTGKMVLETLSEMPLILRLSDGRYLDFRHRTNTIRLRENDETRDWPVIRELPMEEPLGQLWATLADNDRIVLTIGPQSVMKLWSVDTAELTASFQLPFARTEGFSVSADRLHLVVWGDGGRIIIYNMAR